MMKYSSPILSFSRFKILFTVFGVCAFLFLGTYLLRNTALANIVLNAYLDQRLTSGLVGYWSFDGRDIDWTKNKAYDRSGNANDGVFTNMATATAPVIGRVGQGILFDGSNDSVNATGYQTISTFTISAWINHPASVSSYEGIAGYTDVSGSRQEIFIDPSGFAGISGGGSFEVASTPLNNTGWHHMVGTWDGVTRRIYVDGVSVSIGNGNNLAGGDASIMRIGNLTCAGCNYIFNGTIDDVRMYNRVINADEAKRLYNMGNTLRQNVSHRDQLTSGLVGYWTMDGADADWTKNKAYDSSGGGSDGVFTNMATATAPVIGKVGQGILFDGVDDAINEGSVANLDNIGNGTNGDGLTVSAWIYPRSLGEGSFGRIAQKATGIVTDLPVNGWAFYITNTDAANGIKFAVDHATSHLEHPSSANAVTLNSWQHVLLTWDGSTTGANSHIYVNGKEVSYTTASNGVGSRASDASANLLVGNNAGGTATFDGIIDDVRVYNRIISAEEITRLYNMGASFKQNVSKRDQLTSGLVGYWTFDGRDVDWTKNKAYDRSGGGNDGVFTNLTTSTAPVIGKVGQGILFSGATSYLDIPSALSNLSGNNDTFSTWIKLTAYDTWGCVIAATDTGSVVAWQILNDTFIYFDSVHGVTIPATTFADGTWRYLTATYDGTTARVYVNGVEIGNNTFTRSAFAAGAKNFGIGDYIGGLGGGFHCQGTIDDVRIYNRVLPADEIKRLYNMGR